MLKVVQNKPYLFWALVGAAVYIPFLGSTHLFDWDEVNFAESAREMIVSGDFLSSLANSATVLLDIWGSCLLEFRPDQ